MCVALTLTSIVTTHISTCCIFCYAVVCGTQLPPPDCDADVLTAGLSGTDFSMYVFDTLAASSSELHNK